MSSHDDSASNLSDNESIISFRSENGTRYIQKLSFLFNPYIKTCRECYQLAKLFRKGGYSAADRQRAIDHLRTVHNTKINLSTKIINVKPKSKDNPRKTPIMKKSVTPAADLDFSFKSAYDEPIDNSAISDKDNSRADVTMMDPNNRNSDLAVCNSAGVNFNVLLGLNTNSDVPGGNFPLIDPFQASTPSISTVIVTSVPINTIVTTMSTLTTCTTTTFSTNVSPSFTPDCRKRPPIHRSPDISPKLIKNSKMSTSLKPRTFQIHTANRFTPRSRFPNKFNTYKIDLSNGGAHLGPFLFLIFINALTALHKDCTFLLLQMISKY